MLGVKPLQKRQKMSITVLKSKNLLNHVKLNCKLTKNLETSVETIKMTKQKLTKLNAGSETTPETTTNAFN